MIKGIKKSFIGLCLILLSSFCLVGCKDDTVAATGIKIDTNEIILLLEGETIEPNVIIIPSYSSEKSFYFTSTVKDDIIKISGNKITGLKAGEAKLKVVLSSNENINDVITIKVISEPISLTAPKNLTFNGSLIQFEQVDNATGYIMEVNDREISLGQNTSLPFESLIDVLGTIPLDTMLKIRVKALGDENVTISSDYSDLKSYVKLSKPNNLRVENQQLKFDNVLGVEKYDFSICQNSNILFQTEIDKNSNTGYDLTSLSSLFAGGDYVAKLECLQTDYEIPGIDANTLIISSENQINFNVLSAPSNLKMNNYILSWNKVSDADCYDLYTNGNVLIEENIPTNYFDLRTLSLTESQMTLKLKAKSNKTINCIGNINFSDEVSFEILQKPVTSLGENSIAWTNVSNAKYYDVIVKNASDEIVFHNAMTSTELKVDGFGVGGFSYEIYSCGDGINYLSSQTAGEGEFVNNAPITNLAINNKIVSWQSDNEYGYKLDINKQSNVITNSILNNNSFDISSISFDAGEYQISVVALGDEEDNVFASKPISINFCKLSEIENINISNKSLTFDMDAKTVDTNVVCYLNSDENTTVNLTKLSANEYFIDSANLQSDNYTIKIEAIGNNKDILDADNIDKTIGIKKLANPNINLDKVNNQILLASTLADATKYELYQNDIKVYDLTSSQLYYNLGSFNSAEYLYKIKTIGDGACVFDSEISDVKIKIIKLDKPVIEFVKPEKKFEITTEQEYLINDYRFTLNGYEYTVNANIVDCSSSFVNSGEYVAELETNAVASASGYDWVISPENVNLTVRKLDSSATLSLINGKVKISADENISGLTNFVKINKQRVGESGYSSYDYSNLEVQDSKITFDVIDSNFNPIGLLDNNDNALFADAGEYTIMLKLTSDDNLVLDSEFNTVGTLTKLENVGNVSKNANSIVFDGVSLASGYKFKIGDTYFEAETGIEMEDIKLKMMSSQPLVADRNYTIDVLTLGNDANFTISNIIKNAYQFKLLTAPVVDYKLDELDNKVVAITNNLEATNFNVKFVDSAETTVERDVVITQEGISNISIDDIEGLVAGEIRIQVIAENNNNSTNVFASIVSELRYEQLAVPTLSIVNGKINWNYCDVVDHYILSYYKNGSYQTIELSQGVANYAVSSNVASYDLKDIDGETSKLKIQAVSKAKVGTNCYFDSLESDELNVIKLSMASTEIENGEVLVKLEESELANIDSVWINNGITSVNIIDIITDEGEKELSNSMKIMPENLLGYISRFSIDLERFYITVKAKNGTEIGCLDSNVYQCGFKGLKQIDDLNISTTLSYESGLETPETVDKISWTNSALNSGNTKGYKVNINYKNIDYTYIVNGVTTLSFPNEPEFEDGVYTIKVKVLAQDLTEYLNSEWSNEIVLTLCSTPTGFNTVEGILKWADVNSADEYLLRLYDEEGHYINHHITNTSEFNFTNLSKEIVAGVYGVTIQAYNRLDKLVVSSKPSDMFYVVRLPEVSSYLLEMGKLYINCHNLTSKIKLVLTSLNGQKTYELQSSVDCSVGCFKELGVDWNEIDNMSDILNYSQDSAYDYKNIKHLFEVDFSDDQKSFILDCLAAGYTMKITAIGNSDNKFMTVNSYETSSVDGLELANVNVENATNLIKTQAPKLTLSDRGYLEWILENTSYTLMNYNGLQDLLIYNLSLSIGGSDGAELGGIEHNFYMADYLDLRNSYKNCDIHIYTNETPHTFAGYVHFNNGTLEVEDDLYVNINYYIDADGTVIGKDYIDFKQEDLYYVNYLGETIRINLVLGGNFALHLETLGDSTVYLTSNKSTTILLNRYEQLPLSVVDGELSWKNLDTAGDSPVYLLKITDEATSEVKYIYISSDLLDYDIENAPETLENKTYLEQIEYPLDSEAKLKYILDSMNEGEYLFGKGKYNVYLTTYYRDNTDWNTLKSKISEKYEINKLEETTASLQNGKLVFEQISFNASQKVEKYEIVITLPNETKKLWRIDANVVENGNVILELPKTITCVDGEEFEFESNINYAFEIRALAGDKAWWINSNLSDKVYSSISTEVYNIRMEDGLFKWDSDYAGGSYQVKVEWDIEVASLTPEPKFEHITVIQNVYSKEYNLPFTAIDINGNGRQLTSEYKYSISVRRIGVEGSSLSSFYSQPVVCERLKTVETIQCRDGELIWNNITNVDTESLENVSFIIKLADYDDVIVDTNKYGFEEFDAGTITLSLIATHNDYFSASESNEFTAYKLSVIPALTANGVDGMINEIKWNSIQAENGEYANQYTIEIINSEDTITINYKPINISAEYITYGMGNVRGTDISIRIKAIYNSKRLMTGDDPLPYDPTDNSKLINGNWSEEKQFTITQGVEELRFNDDKKRFEWEQITGEQSDDSYTLQYEFNNDPSKVNITINKADCFETNNGENIVKTYYYYPKEIGTYKNICVIVNRANFVSSNPTYIQNDDGNGHIINWTYNFDLFNSGNGSDYPYEITTAIQFANIEFYPTSNFIIANDINLEENLSGRRLSMNYEFKGILDGNNRIVSHYNIDTIQNYVGLFSVLKNATIKDLVLSYINVEMTNVYNSANVYGGVLSAKAENTTFENITILYSLLNINAIDDDSHSQVYPNYYYGGLTGYAKGCTIHNCNVSLGYFDTTENEIINSTITISGWNRDIVYYGTIAGYAKDTNISGDAVIDNVWKSNANLYYLTNITIATGHSIIPSSYIGGVVGAFEGDKNSYSITNVFVTTYQDSDSTGIILYNAGVCGYLIKGTISGVTVQGQIGVERSSREYSTYIGKIFANCGLNVVSLEGNSANGLTLIYEVDNNLIEVKETINQ